MRRDFLKGVVFAACAAALPALALPAGAYAGEWKPQRPVEMVIMAGQGGGADKLARAIQTMIQKNDLSNMPFLPVNKGGGSGAEALRYLKDQAGNPHLIMATLNSYYTTPLMTDIGVDIAEFTPIARLAVDEFVLWVNADSPIKTLDDYVAAVKEKGRDFKMGGTGTNQEDSLVTAMIENAFKIKHTYLPFQGGGDVAKALLGGHVHATVNNPSEAMQFYRAGKLRPLAAFSETRLAELPDVPTMKELGHDLTYNMQRSFVAAPGMPKEVQDYYVELFRKVDQHPEWVKYAENMSLNRAFLAGPELQEMFLRERKQHADLLKVVTASAAN